MSEQPENSRRLPPDDLKVDFGKVFKDASDPKRIAEFHRQEDERHEREIRERAARRRRDCLDLFTARRNSEFACPWCSAVVVDRDKHFDWHEALNATAAEASEAAWRGRPIG